MYMFITIVQTVDVYRLPSEVSHGCWLHGILKSGHLGGARGKHVQQPTCTVFGCCCFFCLCLVMDQATLISANRSCEPHCLMHISQQPYHHAPAEWLKLNGCALGQYFTELRGGHTEKTNYIEFHIKLYLLLRFTKLLPCFTKLF